MKKIGLGLTVVLVMTFILSQPVYAKSMLVETELVSISECPIDILTKPRCLQHVVRANETLSSIARLYSAEERSLTVNDLLTLPGNEYLRERKISVRLAKSLARRGIRRGYDLIFTGDKITIPFTSAKIIERLKEREISFAIQITDERTIKEISAKLDTVSNQKNVAWVAVGIMIILSIILSGWVYVLLRQIKKREKAPVHASEGETVDINIEDIHHGSKI